MFMGLGRTQTRLTDFPDNPNFLISIAPASRLGFASGDMRPFHRLPGNSRFTWFLPDSEVIQRVEITGNPVKRAFRGVPT